MSNQSDISRALQKAKELVPLDDEIASSDFFEELIKNEERFRIVPCEKWGRKVRLEKLSAADRILLFDRSKGDEERTASGWQFSVMLLSKTIADPEGNLSFDSDERREYLERNVADLLDILHESMDLSGIRADSPAKKNGSTRQSSQRPTSSPSPGESSLETSSGR